MTPPSGLSTIKADTFANVGATYEERMLAKQHNKADYEGVYRCVLI